MSGRARPTPTRWPALAIRAVLLAVAVVLTLVVHEPNSVGWLLALAGVAALASVENERWVFGPAARCVEAVVWGIGIRAAGGDNSPLLPYLIAPVFAAGLASGVRAAVVTAACGVLGLVAGAQINETGPSVGLTISLVEWVLIALLIGLVGAWIRNLQVRAAGPAAVHYAQAHKLLEQLQAVATKLPGSLDPVTVAAGLIDDIGGVAKYDEAAVLVTAESDHLVPLAHDGAERVTWDLTRRRTGPFAEAWTTRSKYLRLTRLPRTEAAVAGNTGHGSALVVPLRFGTRTLGVVALEAYAPDTYPKKVAKAVRKIVQAASLPLATASLFDDVRELATAEERRRLSREIHDGIAQELAALGYHVDDLLAEARDGAAGRVVRNLGFLRDRITKLMHEVRLSIFSLRSEVDRHGGLGAALAEYVRTIGTESRLTVHLMLAESPTRLPAQTEAELLRIAQQAIGNAQKHAGGRNLWVKLWVAPPCARLIVEDDGVGIGEPRRNSYGLEIMRERAARVRAKFSVSPRRPAGTTVEVQLVPPRAGDLASLDVEQTSVEWPLDDSRAAAELEEFQTARRPANGTPRSLPRGGGGADDLRGADVHQGLAG